MGSSFKASSESSTQGKYLLDRITTRPIDDDRIPMELRNVGQYFSLQQQFGPRSTLDPLNPNGVVINGRGIQDIKLVTNYKTQADYTEQQASRENGDKVNKAVANALMHLSHDGKSGKTMTERDVKDFVENYAKATLKSDYKPIKWNSIQHSF
jgi:hypothetical protein